MSTLDVVNQAGGKAANFLDVGGGAGAKTIANALEVITGDPKVRSVLINIFGGITRCDLVAQGILDGFSTIDVKVPVVVRLDGTSAEEGRADPGRQPEGRAGAGGHDAGGGQPGRRTGQERSGGLARWRSSSTRTPGSSSRA